MKIQIPILGVMCVAFLLLGCTSATRNVSEPTETVTSISLEYLSNGTNYRNTNLTYKLVPMKGSEFDLRLIKIGKEIKRVLKTSGVEESNNPDIIVFLISGAVG